MVVTADAGRETVLCLNGTPGARCAERPTRQHRVELELPAVEIAMAENAMPLPGAATEQPRVTEEVYEANGARLTVEGRGGEKVEFRLRRNGTNPRVTVDGAEQIGDAFEVVLPAGDGFVTRKVAIKWFG